MATEVAYYTYIYAKVDRKHYLKVTSHTRAAIMGGRFVAGCLGQSLVYTGAMDYLELNYITLGGKSNQASFSNLVKNPSLFLPFKLRYFYLTPNLASTYRNLISSKYTFKINK